MFNDKFFKLEKRIKANTGIDTISITTTKDSIIVDDTSIPECLVCVSNMYGAMYVSYGCNDKVGITDQDLVDFNILQPLKIDGNNCVVSLPHLEI